MINPIIYDVDFAALVRWLIPLPLRKTKIVAWLNVLASPVVYLYQDFLLFKTAKLYQLKITPQVCYLEMLLNDRFDFTTRGIRIVDGVDMPPTYIFQDAELKPLYIRQTAEAAPPVYIYTDGESGALTDDFIIEVPAAVVFDDAEMKSLVKVYKLAGTKFKIQIV